MYIYCIYNWVRKKDMPFTCPFMFFFVSSLRPEFTSWWTVSMTMTEMIGSFKRDLKTLFPNLQFPIGMGFCRAITVTAQWNVEMFCIGLHLHVVIAFFGFATRTLLLYLQWFIPKWRFMPVSAMCQHYPIKLGCLVAPEIALKCNISAAILGLLPLSNNHSPSESIHIMILSIEIMFERRLLE